MTALDQSVDTPVNQSANQARMIEEIFAPSNYAAFIQSLKMERTQGETGKKNDEFAAFINMDQKDGRGSLTVSADHPLKYTVKDGDSLWSIVSEALTKKTGEAPTAWKTLDTLRRIAESNRMSNPDLIHAGDVIDFSVIGDLQNGEETGRQEQRQARTLHNPETGKPIVPYSNNGGGVNEPVDRQMRTETPTESSRRNSWYISQAGDNYGCAPTSLTMALAANGLMEPTEANRQRLIRETGTNREVGFPGTSSLMAEEARRRGLQAEAHYTTDWRAVDAELSKGRQAIVNGTTIGRDGTTLFKHFVFISGKDAAGNYLVGDPTGSRPTTWSQSEVAAFLTRGPAPNGFTAVWR